MLSSVSKGHDAVSSLGLEFDKICILITANFQQWERAIFFVYPNESGMDKNWNQDANGKSYLEGRNWCLTKKAFEQQERQQGGGGAAAVAHSI